MTAEVSGGVYTQVPSPIGDLLLGGDGETLSMLHIAPERWTQDTHPGSNPDWVEDAAPFRSVVEQLRAYFAGELTDFDVPLAMSGTPFQLRVWAQLCEIPYGETASYGEIASRLGQLGASRAVGLANNRNPVAVIVPCHRVIGANGSMVGYGGGLERKRFLLGLEALHSPNRDTMLF